MSHPVNTPCGPQSAQPSVGASRGDATRADASRGDASGLAAACGSSGRDSHCSLVVAMSVACLVFAIAYGLHATAVRGGVAADSTWFAATGLFFLLITAASHLILSRESTSGALVSLMISMAIRLLGTFLVLGGLLILSPLSRPEAVFNVLFWYITLTATDLVSVVRQKNRVAGGDRLPCSPISVIDSR